jgi:tRNA-specific adenosine deaminase 3
MATFDPPLSDLSPFLITAPASPARSLDQLRVKSAIWPTLYAPSPVRPTTSHTWSPARKAWVKAGIYRVLSLARAAKAKGELPVAVFCTSPPQHFWPGPDGFIPPTTGLRAVSHDTRTSEAHPLRHATLNCIASIARLRTVPPFNVVQPTRNGADYLLTSLSLFCTHEPCVMCCMALLHSRVREVFYVFPRPRGGGFEGAFGVHGRRDLNHRFEAWRWSEGGMEGWEEELRVDEGVAI